MAARYASPTPTDQMELVEGADQQESVSHTSPTPPEQMGLIESKMGAMSLDKETTKAAHTTAVTLDSHTPPCLVNSSKSNSLAPIYVSGNLSIVQGSQTNFAAGSSQSNIGNQTNYVTSPASREGLSSENIALDFNLGECQEELKELYQDEMGKVKLLPWGQRAADIADVGAIFVDLELVKEEQAIHHSEESKKLDSNEELVNLKTSRGQRSNRVLVQGEGGSGKSTLLDNVAYKWAIQDSKSPLSQYQLVFIIRMKEIEDNASLVDLILQQILPEDSKVSKEGLQAYIISHAKDILFLIDGLDEDSSGILKNKSGEVTKVLHNRKLRKSCVILTTRPHRVNDLGEHQIKYTQVKLTGFSRENIELYIHKFMNDTDKSTQLVKTLSQEPNVMAMSSTPVLLLMICLLWEDQCRLPDTKTKLYTETMKYLWRRYHNKLAPGSLNEDDDDDMQTESKNFLMQLGKVVLNSTSTHTDKIMFNQCDFGTELFELGCQVGLISRERLRAKLRVKNCVTFLHKSFQDFCAALYLADLLNTNRQEFDKKLRLTTYNALMIELCCGLNTKFIPIFIKRTVNSADKGPLDFAFHLRCIFEGQLTSKECCELVPLYSSVEIIRLRIDYSIVPCILYQLDLIRSTGAHYPNVFTILHNLHVVTGCFQWIHSLLQYTTNLNIMQLSITNIFGLNPGLQLLFKAILGLQHLTQLTMIDMLNHRDVIDITKGLNILLTQTKRNQFTELAFTGFAFDCKVMAKLVKSNSSLQFLSLTKHYASRTHLPGKEILKVLPDLKHVEGLDLSGIKISAIRPLRSIIGHIQVLSLNSNRLDDANMRELFSFLNRAEKLRELHLSYNNISVPSTESLVRCLKALPHIEVLVLVCTGLNDKSAIMLAACIKDIPTMHALNVSENPDIGTEGHAALADPGLTQRVRVVRNMTETMNWVMSN